MSLTQKHQLKIYENDVQQVIACSMLLGVFVICINIKLSISVFC